MDINIKFNKVLLIDEEGNKQLMSKEEAYKIADEAELDLVQVNVNENVSICKLLDYEKEVYRQEKEKKRNKKCGSKHTVKEIRINWKICDNDLITKVSNCKRIVVKDKDTVKVTIRYKCSRATDFAYKQSNDILNRVRNLCAEWGKCSDIKYDNGNAYITIERGD